MQPIIHIVSIKRSRTRCRFRMRVARFLHMWDGLQQGVIRSPPKGTSMWVEVRSTYPWLLPEGFYLPRLADAGSTTKGAVFRKNCSVVSCVTATQQPASTVKWLISKGHFPARMAVKMHNEGLRTGLDNTNSFSCTLKMPLAYLPACGRKIWRIRLFNGERLVYSWCLPRS